MTKNKLYSCAIYLPIGLLERLPYSITHISYCPHAQEKAQERNIDLPKNIFGGQIVEIETEDDKIIKAVYRIHYSKNKDLTLVFHIKNDLPVMVRTLWINQHGKDKQINPDRYCHG